MIKRNIPRFWLICLMLLPMIGIMLLAGCGGSGDKNSWYNTVDPTMGGRWVGSWSSLDNTGENQIGVLDMTVVSPSGNITGTIASATNLAPANVAGSINRNGSYNVTYTYPGGVEENLTGTLVQQTNSDPSLPAHLVGTITKKVNGITTGTTSVDLIYQTSLQNQANLIGHWKGDWTGVDNSGNSSGGIAEITVSSSGSLSGVLSNGITSAPIIGAVTPAGGVVAKYTLPGEEATTLTGAMVVQEFVDPVSLLVVRYLQGTLQRSIDGVNDGASTFDLLKQ
ncbi:MAG: hypothetical protein WCO51_00370 [bacterium]